MGSTKMVATYVMALLKDELADWNWREPRDSWGEVVGTMIAALSSMALLKLRGEDLTPHIQLALKAEEIEVEGLVYEEPDFEFEGTGKRALWLAWCVFIDVATLDFDDVEDLVTCKPAWKALVRGRVGEAVDHLYDEVD